METFCVRNELNTVIEGYSNGKIEQESVDCERGLLKLLESKGFLFLKSDGNTPIL